MALILGFAELLGAFLLITKGIGGKDVTWQDILRGNAGKIIKGQENASSSTPTTAGATSIAGNYVPTNGQFTPPNLVPSGGGKLNSSQQTFAQRLAQDTGLNLAVVQGWVLSEEPASSSAAPNGANNWLNIGDTGSGNYGGAASVWADPTTAADFTAHWISGLPLPGYGVASQGIQGIVQSASGSILSQVKAIQNSGWAASGYPNLGSVVAEFL